VTDWQDLLAERVRELEAKARGYDPSLPDKARAMLRVIRGYEVRVRRLAVRAAQHARAVTEPVTEPALGVLRVLARGP
jgi:hypothetical protein